MVRQVMAVVNKHETKEEKAIRQEAIKSIKDGPKINKKPPTSLDRVGKAEYRRLIALLADSVSALDENILATYCATYSAIVACQKAIKSDGTILDGGKINPAVKQMDALTKTLRSLANDLGLTPQARLKMAWNNAKQEDNSDPFKALVKS
ncbi:phage terminase small subunit P27 family [Lactobacillus agilis]|uniref:Phage terminase small subunit P27 family n=1 Tax=Ligilactobacillus agilis TaxID=1601 RepID=A0A848C656_9LACO|nr:phage terminase small subunit P27 family [Ligilactobacillus agilis]NME41577.1 phage terminase small subunit P27 family [Ligilactobacillus agilis]